MSQTLIFQNALLTWFDTHGRKDLPWQQDLSHYRVWVSEIMLQQTQVKTVIPYFNRFMQRFPTLLDLAEAPLDLVLQHWAGLGYYARARNLHKAARIIANEYGGQFPNTISAVSSLPGIGRSTAAAILSIVEQQALAILDGNVKRVLTRVHAIRGYPGDKKINDELWQIAERYTPSERAGHYTQAMMDLGATLCTRSKPRCTDCPVQTHCKAHAKAEVSLYPGKKPSKVNPVRQAHFLLMVDPNGRILLEQRPAQGIWGGLWTLPSFDDLTALQMWLTECYGAALTAYCWPERKHVFTHFSLLFTPVQVNMAASDNYSPNDLHSWYAREEIAQLGLPAPIKHLLNDYYKAYHEQNDLLCETKTAS